MKRLCLLVIGSNFLDKPGLHKFLTGNNAVIPDWWHYLDTCYILQTALTLAQLQDQLVRQFPNQQFLLQEINPKRSAGWLPREAWNWLARYTGWSVAP